MKKDEIFDALETLDFPRDSYIVIGGASLFFLRRVIKWKNKLLEEFS